VSHSLIHFFINKAGKVLELIQSLTLGFESCYCKHQNFQSKTLSLGCKNKTYTIHQRDRPGHSPTMVDDHSIIVKNSFQEVCISLSKPIIEKILMKENMKGSPKNANLS